MLISSAWPYPVDSGKRVVLAGLVAHFTSRVGADAVHYVHVGAPPDAECEPPFVVHRIAPPRAREQVARIAWHAVLRGDRSVQESVLLSREVGRRLAEVLAGIGPSLQVFDTVRMAQYARTIPAPPGARRVVYLDDLFSVRYARMLDAMAAHPGTDLNVLGEFGSEVLPGRLRALAAHRPVQRVVLRLERRLVARSEDRVAREFARSLLVNPEEAALLRERAGAAGVDTIAPLLRAPGDGPARRYGGAPEYVFLGLLTLPHNDVSLRAFLQRQLPALLDAVPEARLRVVGRGATPELRQLAARFGKAVTIEGWLPDLDDVLTRACALVNPLLFGTGIKLKVLEALARGLPVVSTRTGVEGVASGPEHGCCVEDDLDRHPALLAELLDPSVNARLSAAGRRHYRRTFAPQAVQAAYDRVFAPVDERRG